MAQAYFWIYGLFEGRDFPDDRRRLVVGIEFEAPAGLDPRPLVAEQVREHYATQLEDPDVRWVEWSVLAVPSGPVILSPLATALHHIVADYATLGGVGESAWAARFALDVLAEVDIPATRQIIRELRNDGITDAAIQQARKALAGLWL